MPKAAVLSETSSNRHNPYIVKGINRSLLTPCRQIGLSRKKKTPNSLNKSLRQDDSLVNTSTDSLSLNTTPVSAIVCEPSNSQRPPENGSQVSDEDVLTPVTNKREAKTVSSKPSKKNALNSSDEDNDSEKDEIKRDKVTSKQKKTSNSKKSKKKKADEGNANKRDEHACNKTPNKSGSEVVSSGQSTGSADFEKSKTKERPARSRKIVRRILSSDDESALNEPPKLLPIENNLSDKDSDPSKLLPVLDEDIENIQLTPNTNDDSSKNDEPPLLSPVVDTIPRQYYNKSKFKRCLSMKKSSSEDSKVQIEKTSPAKYNLKNCSVRLSSIEDKNTVDIESLRDCIKEKRKLVENLKQAEIYQKLHDVAKLQELTSLWKNGCIQALNDLLPHLQAHANIDMAMLLKNLKIPPEKITVSPNGDLM